MDIINYKKRIADKQVEEYLKLFGAVVIEGPKYCGKTWTAMTRAKSSIFIGDPKNNFQNRNIYKRCPNPHFEMF